MGPLEAPAAQLSDYQPAVPRTYFPVAPQNCSPNTVARSSFFRALRVDQQLGAKCILGGIFCSPVSPANPPRAVVDNGGTWRDGRHSELGL